MRRRLLALALAPLLVVGVAACGEKSAPEAGPAEVDSGQSIDGVSVEGEVGSVPKVEIDTPLKLEKSTSELVTEGEGDPVLADEQALLHLYVANGTTGKKAAATYDQGQPVNIRMSEDQLFPVVLEAILGKPAGSRVAVAAVPDDAYGKSGSQLGLGAEDNIVFVVDVMSVAPTEVLDGPEGDEVEPPADAPTVVEDEKGTVTGLDFENAPAKPSGQLEVVTLIEGQGPPARKASLVTFDYLGQIYGTDKVFDESYSKEPVTFPLGTGGLIPAWDEGLVGVKRGSRVLIIAPPKYGYGKAGNPGAGISGNDTLAFVVDILGVS